MRSYQTPLQSPPLSPPLPPAQDIAALAARLLLSFASLPFVSEDPTQLLQPFPLLLLPTSYHQLALTTQFTLHHIQPTQPCHCCRANQLWANSRGRHALAAAGPLHRHAARTPHCCYGLRPETLAVAAAAGLMHTCSGVALGFGVSQSPDQPCAVGRGVSAVQLERVSE